MNFFKKLRKRRALEHDLADELAFHQAMRAADSDHPPFGNEVRIRESIRDFWRFHWIETTGQDLAYAFRGLRNNPGFSLTAIGSLALGIAGVIAIFSAADALLFRPLPYPDPDRLVMVWEQNRTRPQTPRNVVSPANFLDWKSRNRVFQQLVAIQDFRTVMLHGDRTEQFRMLEVSEGFFEMLGAKPLLGRTFTADEYRPGSRALTPLVISHRLWQSWFGGENSVIGTRVTINASPYIILGVMPADFYFRNREVDLWGAQALDPAVDYRASSGRYMLAAARLKSDIPLRQAQTEMKALAAALEREYPAFDRNWTVNVEPLRDSLVFEVRTSLIVLLAAVGLLLAVACSNVANLLLARNASRRAEFATRISLGAGRLRLFRQLLTESLLLATLSGAAGLFLGRLALARLVLLAPQALGRTADIHVDTRVVLFAVAISALCGILFGLMPALSAARADLSTDLKRGGRWNSAGLGSLRAWLIAGEVAVSVILLAGASLLFQSLVRLQHVESGIDTSNLLTFRATLRSTLHPDPRQSPRFFATAVERIRQLPGVRSASGVNTLPFDGIASGTHFGMDGIEANGTDDRITTVRTVMPRYFETIGIPLRRGRDFTPADNTVGSPLRFVVNEAFVHRYLSGRDPLGVSLSVRMDAVNPFGEIIGVVGDVKEGALSKAPSPTVYYAHANLISAGMTLVVRTNTDPLAVVPSIRKIMRDLDPTVPLAEVRTMETILAETYARERFSAILLISFSLAAALLAAIGIYGVLAWAVQEQTREIGVRLALGATTNRVMGMVLGAAARFVTAGIIVGLAGAFIASKSIESLLFGVPARDPLAFSLAPATILLVAAVATLIPARKAATTDPIQALR